LDVRWDDDPDDRHMSMDTTLRSDLREIIEVNYVRFEARLEQRMAQLETKLIRWTFAFWVPTALGIIGTAIAVVAFLVRR